MFLHSVNYRKHQEYSLRDRQNNNKIVVVHICVLRLMKNNNFDYSIKLKMSRSSSRRGS